MKHKIRQFSKHFIVKSKNELLEPESERASAHFKGGGASNWSIKVMLTFLVCLFQSIRSD